MISPPWWGLPQVLIFFLFEVVSVGYMLLSRERSAKRLICLGGCPPLLGQLPITAADQIALTAVDALELGGIPSSEIVQRLIDLPIHDLGTKLPPTIPMLPVIDGEVIPEEVTLKTFSQGTTTMPGKEWVNSIMMESSSLDVRGRMTIRPMPK